MENINNDLKDLQTPDNSVYVYLAKLNNLEKIKNGIYKNENDEHFVLTKMGFVAAEQYNLKQFIADNLINHAITAAQNKELKKTITNLKSELKAQKPEDFYFTDDDSTSGYRKSFVRLLQELQKNKSTKKIVKDMLREKNIIINDLRIRLKQEKKFTLVELIAAQSQKSNELDQTIISEEIAEKKTKIDDLQQNIALQHDIFELNYRLETIENYLIEVLFKLGNIDIIR